MVVGAVVMLVRLARDSVDAKVEMLRVRDREWE